ncbi:hypothetical protein SUGI_0289360 [Cryptomeria japonica]|nr:hypothetical protein SUGI_0289360 [Cryptomeria japonica]
MVNFDALDDEEEKEIFLDISCFFIGTEKDLAITVWEESGWSGAGSLGTLMDKSLVEVDEKNCLRMHDLLRDLGRDISKTRSPYRLWSPEQITHIQQQGKGNVLIRGIKARIDEFYEEFVELVRESSRGIKRKWGLKILDVEKNYFTEELATLSGGLVSLRWAKFPHRAIPSWISLKKLRVLKLCDASKLEESWNEIADDGNLGTTSLGILYTSLIVCSFIAAPVARRLASLYLGFTASIIWVVEGTYLTSVARSHAIECNLPEGKVLGNFNEEFWGAFASYWKAQVTQALHCCLEQAFVWAKFTKFVVKPAIGVAGVGGAMAIFGAADAIIIHTYGALCSHILHILKHLEAWSSMLSYHTTSPLSDNATQSESSIMWAQTKKKFMADPSAKIERLEIEALRSENMELQSMVEENHQSLSGHSTQIFSTYPHTYRRYTLDIRQVQPLV